MHALTPYLCLPKEVSHTRQSGKPVIVHLTEICAFTEFLIQLLFRFGSMPFFIHFFRMLLVVKAFVLVHVLISLAQCHPDIPAVFLDGTSDGKYYVSIFFTSLSYSFDLRIKFSLIYSGKNNGKFISACTEDIFFIKHFSKGIGSILEQSVACIMSFQVIYFFQTVNIRKNYADRCLLFFLSMTESVNIVVHLITVHDSCEQVLGTEHLQPVYKKIISDLRTDDKGSYLKCFLYLGRSLGIKIQSPHITHQLIS